MIGLMKQKILLLITHGNATVESGFSVNKDLLLENLKEHTVVAQRIVYDFVKSSGGALAMDEATLRDELLRENCCIGNLDNIKKLVLSGASINSQNSVNGMTALHWACKRNHKTVVKFLLESGANSSIPRHDGILSIDLSTCPEIRSLIDPEATPLSVDAEKSEDNKYIPGYLRNPEFPYSSESLTSTGLVTDQLNQDTSSTRQSQPQLTNPSEDNIVLKVRQAGNIDGDFYEILCQRSTLSYDSFLKEVCKELEVKSEDVVKLRKLPSTVIRKTEELKRLEPYQEIELVTK